MMVWLLLSRKTDILHFGTVIKVAGEFSFILLGSDNRATRKINYSTTNSIIQALHPMTPCEACNFVCL